MRKYYGFLEDTAVFFFLKAHGILVPGPGIELVPPAVKQGVLTTGPPTLIYFTCGYYEGFSHSSGGKEPTCQCRRHKRCRFNPWVGKIPWRRRAMATYSSSLSWGIPGMVEPGGLRSMGSHRVGHDSSRDSKLEKAMAPHSSTLTWRIPWSEEPGGLQLMGLLRVRHD